MTKPIQMDMNHITEYIKNYTKIQQIRHDTTTNKTQVGNKVKMKGNKSILSGCRRQQGQTELNIQN